MTKYSICPTCGQRVKVEYGNKLREHHRKIAGTEFYSICTWSFGTNTQTDDSTKPAAIETLRIGQAK